jgi:hypothetical protein
MRIIIFLGQKQEGKYVERCIAFIKMVEEESTNAKWNEYLNQRKDMGKEA